MENEIAIYYATMTGNAEELAGQMEIQCKKLGRSPRLINLADASPKSIQEINTALFIVSTWGDGEPPEDAEDFYEDLVDSSENLNALRYAVLGLGDSSYPEFNAFARNLDSTLESKGAKAFIEKAEADFDFEDTFDVWANQVHEALEARLQTTESA